MLWDRKFGRVVRVTIVTRLVKERLLRRLC